MQNFPKYIHAKNMGFQLKKKKKEKLSRDWNAIYLQENILPIVYLTNTCTISLNSYSIVSIIV